LAGRRSRQALIGRTPLTLIGWTPLTADADWLGAVHGWR